MNCLYKIKVLSWSEHNPGHKKYYKKFLLHNNIINDPKLNAMPISHRWLWIGILSICADHANDTITVTHRQLNDILSTKEGAHNALERFQYFQLLTYEKHDLNEIKGKKIKQSKMKESSSEVAQPPSLAPVSDPPKLSNSEKKEITDRNRRVWEAYKESYIIRWKVEPVRNKTVNTQISHLVQRLGEDDAIAVVRFYLTHNNGFYVQQTHPVGLCLKDCESLRTQMLRGKAITRNDVRNFEKQMNTQDTLTALRNGEV